mmetsp:Transcript_28151/g.32810  ORF Transcript_28151/g.32810 Transcript_28151/m.32810 type:complete len:483 (+) Transcript_28151:58-1506(+)
MSHNNNETPQVYIFYALYSEEVPRNVKAVFVHPSVTRIPEHAFANCDQLEIVKLPDGLKIIDIHAFSGCVKLRRINFPATLENIYAYGFYGCVSLKEVKLPPSLRRIYQGTFCDCTSLRIVNLPPLLEEISAGAFCGCISLITVHIPTSLQRIGLDAFGKCYSLISVELPPTVQVGDNDAFYMCFTLQLRQQQVDNHNLTLEQRLQRSRENTRYLKRRNDELPIHKICSDPKTTLDQLQSILISKDNIRNTLQQTDELGLTALHSLCLNSKATPEMLKIVTNACPQARTMQAEVVTHVVAYEYVFDGDNDDDYDNEEPETMVETRELVNPLKLWLKMKGIPYNDDEDFNEDGHMTLSRVLTKGMKWNEIVGMVYIQQSISECIEKNESTKLYPFMQVATIGVMDKLEIVYQLSLFDTRLVYESTDIHSRKEDIVVTEGYELARSFRRGATSTVQNAPDDVYSPEDIDRIGRWAGSKAPTLRM